MKKLVCIVLLGSLFISVTGYHFLFYLAQWEIKSSVQKKIRSQLKPGDTEQFLFDLTEKKSSESPEWASENEFSFKGEMYDVLEKRLVKGEIYVQCISDKKETELIKKYQDISRNDWGGSSKKKTILLLKLINSVYTITCSSGYNKMIHSGQHGWSPHKYPLTITSAEVLTPPPRQV